MSLDAIKAQLSSKEIKQSNKVLPLDEWDPDYCGEIDLQIKNNGDWFYAGTIFKRPALVKLFASVIKKEEHEFFLVTPVEKIKITVEDAPFILTEWWWQDEEQSIMMVKTNVGDEFVLNKEHPLTLNAIGELYITVRRNLLAKVHRNVYYHWVDLAQEQQTEKGSELVFISSQYKFSLGVI